MYHLGPIFFSMQYALGAQNFLKNFPGKPREILEIYHILIHLIYFFIQTSFSATIYINHNELGTKTSDNDTNSIQRNQAQFMNSFKNNSLMQFKK